MRRRFQFFKLAFYFFNPVLVMFPFGFSRLLVTVQGINQAGKQEIANIFNPVSHVRYTVGLLQFVVPDLPFERFWYGVYGAFIYFSINAVILHLRKKSIPLSGEFVHRHILMYAVGAMLWIILWFFGKNIQTLLPLLLCLISVAKIYVYIQKKKKFLSEHEKRYIKSVFSIFFSFLISLSIQSCAEILVAENWHFFGWQEDVWGILFQFTAAVCAVSAILLLRDYIFAASGGIYLLTLVYNKNMIAVTSALLLLALIIFTGIACAVYDWQIRYKSSSRYIKPSAHKDSAADKSRS